jgi:hypothetical protein
MENIKEIYQALLDGKTLRYKKSGRLTNIDNETRYAFDVPEDWEIYELSEWEMEPAKWLIDIDGTISYSDVGRVTNVQRFGNKYHSKVQAEEARDQTKRANLLRYWVSTLQDLTLGTYYLFKNSDGTWDATTTGQRNTLDTVYMTKETAIKICNAFNNGELKLDPSSEV